MPKQPPMHKGCDPGSGAFVVPLVSSIRLRDIRKKPGRRSRLLDCSSRNLPPTSQTNTYGCSSLREEPACFHESPYNMRTISVFSTMLSHRIWSKVLTGKA